MVPLLYAIYYLYLSTDYYLLSAKFNLREIFMDAKSLFAKSLFDEHMYQLNYNRM